MKAVTGVRDEAQERLPDWESENTVLAICEALLERSHYWEF